MTQKRIFIIHGWSGWPQEGWFPWLKRSLEKRGAQVFVPQMPNAQNPKMAEWVAEIGKLVGVLDANTYFVGHSLGCITILRYFEQLTGASKAGGAVLVAGFSEDIGFSEIKDFVSAPLNYEKVKSVGGKIIAINSDDDPFVPLQKGEVMRDRLGAELVVMRGAGHINQEKEFFKLPIAFKKVCQIAGLKRWKLF